VTIKIISLNTIRGESRTFEKPRGRRSNALTASSFVTNAHNKLYAFYTGKDDLLKKVQSHWGHIMHSLHHTLTVFES